MVSHSVLESADITKMHEAEAPVRQADRLNWGILGYGSPPHYILGGQRKLVDEKGY
jgi:hypothetical protein